MTQIYQQSVLQGGSGSLGQALLRAQIESYETRQIEAARNSPKAEDRLNYLNMINPASLSQDHAQDLCEILFDVDPRIRQRAVAILSQSARCAPIAAPFICELLSLEECRENLLIVINSLEKFGKTCSKTAPRLISLMEFSQDNSIRDASISALIKLDAEPGLFLPVLKKLLLQEEAALKPGLYELLERCGKKAQTLIPEFRKRLNSSSDYEKVTAARVLGTLGIRDENIASMLSTLALPKRFFESRWKNISLSQSALAALCLQKECIRPVVPRLMSLYERGSEAPIECCLLALRATGLAGTGGRVAMEQFGHIIRGPHGSKSYPFGKKVSAREQERICIEALRAAIRAGMTELCPLMADALTQAFWANREKPDGSQLRLAGYLAVALAVLESNRKVIFHEICSERHLNTVESENRFYSQSAGSVLDLVKQGSFISAVTENLTEALPNLFSLSKTARRVSQDCEDFFLTAIAGIGPEAQVVSARVLELLKDEKDSWKKRKYVEMLRAIGKGNKVIVAELADLVMGKDTSLAIIACEILELVGPDAKESRNALTLALFSENAELRRKANSALGTIGCDAFTESFPATVNKFLSLDHAEEPASLL